MIFREGFEQINQLAVFYYFQENISMQSFFFVKIFFMLKVHLSLLQEISLSTEIYVSYVFFELMMKIFHWVFVDFVPPATVKISRGTFSVLLS